MAGPNDPKKLTRAGARAAVLILGFFALFARVVVRGHSVVVGLLAVAAFLALAVGLTVWWRRRSEHQIEASKRSGRLSVDMNLHFACLPENWPTMARKTLPGGGLHFTALPVRITVKDGGLEIDKRSSFWLGRDPFHAEVSAAEITGVTVGPPCIGIIGSSITIALRSGEELRGDVPVGREHAEDLAAQLRVLAGGWPGRVAAPGIRVTSPPPSKRTLLGRRWPWQRRRLGRLMAGVAMAAVLLVGVLLGGSRMRGGQPASTRTISLTFAATTPSGRPDGAQLADTARILSRRMDAAGIQGGSVLERAGRLLVAVPAAQGRDDIDHITALLTTPGRLELRPVLQAAIAADPRPPFSAARCTAAPPAPAPDKPVVLCLRPPGAAGAANADVKLLVGPAGLGNREIAAAEAAPSGLPADSTWQIVLRLTGQGGRLFQQLSGTAACQPADSIRRHIAIVLDGTVIEYPPVADAVPCGEGFSAGAAIAISRLPEQEARKIAALMTAGSLPVRLERQP